MLPALGRRTLDPFTYGGRRVMGTKQSGKRANVLKGRELVIEVEERSAAAAGVVYDLLADLSTHLEWGGARQRGKSRLLSLDAAPGAAGVGTEFSTTGEDPMCLMHDRSVVTEASPARTFEFVTESLMDLKRGSKRSEWTLVHRYEIVPEPGGCRVTFRSRITRVSAFPGLLALFRVPGLRAIALKEAASGSRAGLRNLLQMAEERAGATAA
jgi:hypothetical protein